MDGVDEAKRNEIIEYIKTQGKRQFGVDALLIVYSKNEEETRQAVMALFSTVQDSVDARDRLLALNYAKELKARLIVKYDAANAAFQALSEQDNQGKQKILNEKQAWDKNGLELEDRKLKLINATTNEPDRLYSDCVATFTEKAALAKSPKDWWKTPLKQSPGKNLKKSRKESLSYFLPTSQTTEIGFSERLKATLD